MDIFELIHIYLGIVKFALPICNARHYTDILVNVNFTCICCCPIFLISHQIHGTPNTRFFMFFFQDWEEKNV